MANGEQQALTEWTTDITQEYGEVADGNWTFTPLSALRSDIDQATVREMLGTWGLDEDWVGKQPEEVPGDREYYRFQFNKVFFFPVSDGARGDTEIAPIEFRTHVDWVGGRPDPRLREYLREEANPRLRALFDTGRYQMWMTNFNFVKQSGYTELEEVAADEVSNLGVPKWDVTVRKNGRVQGEANGFLDPFRLAREAETEGEAPAQEVWNITGVNTARDAYQIAPPGRSGARERAKEVRGKSVYLNGKYIGDVVKDGRVWLKLEYQGGQTYRGQWSREAIVGNTDATYSAIRDGGNAYKTRETPDEVYLVTAQARPDDFEAVDPSAVDPSDTGFITRERIQMDLDYEGTDFHVRTDQGPLLGKFTPPVYRRVEEKRAWNVAAYGRWQS